MLIPDNMLQTLLCVECEQYLSFSPIKVYPNRHVKCSRCARDTDNGVVSPVYETVVKGFEFPCINRFEGCEQVLKYGEVKKHEENCVIKHCYVCPLCNNFESSAYNLQLHLKQTHSSYDLHAKEVILRIDKGNSQRISWLCDDNLLLILFCNYDFFERNLALNIHIVGKQNREGITQHFTIFNVENNIKLKSKQQDCSLWGLLQVSDVRFTINPDDFPSGVAICRFNVDGFVGKMSNCMTIKNKFNSTSSSVTIDFSCNIFNSSFYNGDKQYYKDVICVNNSYWGIYLRSIEGINNKDSETGILFVVYLVYHRREPIVFRCLRVKTTLISKTPRAQHSKELEIPSTIINRFGNRGYWEHEIHSYSYDHILKECREILVKECITYQITLSCD